MSEPKPATGIRVASCPDCNSVHLGLYDEDSDDLPSRYCTFAIADAVKLQFDIGQAIRSIANRSPELMAEATAAYANANDYGNGPTDPSGRQNAPTTRGTQ